MARFIAVTAYLTARPLDAGLPVSRDTAFDVPGWDTDSIKPDEEGIRVWLSRAISVDDGEDDMARATKVAEEEGLSAPSGWKIIEVDFFPHVDLGPDPEIEAGASIGMRPF